MAGFGVVVLFVLAAVVFLAVGKALTETGEYMSDLMG